MILNRANLYETVAKELGFNPSKLTPEQESYIDSITEFIDDKFWTIFKRRITEEQAKTSKKI